MLRFYHWQVWRYIAQHRALALLNVLSVACGVAVFLAIQLANRSATAAFAATIDLIAGKAQLEVTAPANDLPEDLLPRVQQTAGISAVTPLVRGLVTLPDFPGEYLDVLGVDVFTNTPFRTFELTNFNARDFDLEAWLGRGDSIALSQAFVARHGLQRGQPLRLQVNGREQIMRIAFVLQPSEMREGDEHVAAMDIGWAQELFGMRGRLSQIQLQIAPGANRRQVQERLRATLPANIEVAPPSRRNEQIDKLLGSFRLNLTAMSLVSLFVGAFLIFNTISASVIRRRREIGILRALGTSRWQVGALFLGEAMTAGIAGTLLGLILGTWLTRALIGGVSETISSLYVLVNVRSVTMNPADYLAASALGLTCAFLAAFFPARAAAFMPPVAALHPEVHSDENKSASSAWLACGILMLGAGVTAGFIALRSGPAWISFLSALFCLSGASCFSPWLVSGLALAGHGLSPARLAPRLAALNFRRALFRNSVTVAALGCALAMAVGVSVMIFSFRQTVTAWIEQTLVADVFITPAANEIAGPSSFLPADALAFLEQNPAVSAVDTFRYVELPFRGGRMALAAIRAAGPRDFLFVNGNRAAQMARFRNQPCVIVSESFARHYHLKPGDQLPLATPDGTRSLPIAAVFYDYTRDDGVVYLSDKTFRNLFHDDRVHSAGVYLKPGADLDALAAAFRQKFGTRGEFAIYSNRALRRRIFEVFDQTFAVTYVLRAIAIIVALAGIFLSFSTLILERSRTFAIMRAIGMSRRQLGGAMLWESVFVGVGANVLGLCAGMMLALVLTVVVNPAFFGWTVHLALPWTMLALTPVWIIPAAMLAAIIPALRATRLQLAQSLRTE
ncbi:MAG: FtsX-like permease family protein [Verrucomicrobia bacterium]|nr:FtsX-like permease family protein [Verrucomicrobiota bacterium]